MQTWAKPWAKRGVQAALVTGGMIAAGTGVASATENCPNRPAAPLGESALSPENGLSRQYGIPCFAGELFPELEIPSGPRHAAVPPTRFGEHSVPFLSGTLDPAPSSRHGQITLEDRLAHRDGAGGGLHRRSPNPTLEVPSGLRSTGRHQLPPRAPAQGFHRSVSWSGPIEHVVREDSMDTVPIPTVLVPPREDPATEMSMETDGIVGLWQDKLGAGLVNPDGVDLTVTDLSGPATTLRPIPDGVLDQALLAKPAPVAPQRDSLPNVVPGDDHLKIGEIPNLSGDLTLSAVSTEPAPLPDPVSHITRALEGEPVRTANPLVFSPTPLRSPVWISTADKTITATDPERLVTLSPLRMNAHELTMPDLRLPLTRGIPDLSAMRDEIDDALLHELETTVPIPHLASRL